MKPIPLPNAAYLRLLLDYDQENGRLTWRHRDASLFAGSTKRTPLTCSNVWNGKNAGKPALNSLMANGYLHGAIDYQHYLAHRVIWKIVTGDDPEQIDHIDGDRSNNRFTNMRDALDGDNARNRGLSSNNKSGYHGIYDNHRGGYYAQIEHNEVVKHIGTFKTFKEAVAARKAAELMLDFHLNHGERLGHKQP